MTTALKLTQRAVDMGCEVLREQLERMISMSQSKPSTTKRSGNGSKRKGTKKLRALAKR